MFEEHSRGSQFKVNEDALIISDDEVIKYSLWMIHVHINCATSCIIQISQGLLLFNYLSLFLFCTFPLTAL